MRRLACEPFARFFPFLLRTRPLAGAEGVADAALGAVSCCSCCGGDLEDDSVSTSPPMLLMLISTPSIDCLLEMLDSLSVCFSDFDDEERKMQKDH